MFLNNWENTNLNFSFLESHVSAKNFEQKSLNFSNCCQTYGIEKLVFNETRTIENSSFRKDLLLRLNLSRVFFENFCKLLFFLQRWKIVLLSINDFWNLNINK